MSLFPPTRVFLHILWNDFPYQGDPFSLFDARTFKQLRLVTYVSTPAFFFEKIAPFEKVIGILGEEETEISFAQLYPKTEESLTKSATEYPALVNRILDGSVQLRYARLNESIHSKLYILSTEDGTFHRVMVGSANFTSKALQNRNQYEELIVYDSTYNPNFCEAYLRRFEELYRASQEFFSVVTKKKLKNLLVHADSVFIVTPEERAEIVIEKVAKEVSQSLEATNLVINFLEEKRRSEERAVEIERVEKIVEQITRKQRDGYIFEPKDRLKTLKDKLVEAVSYTHPRSKDFVDKRKVLFFDRARYEFLVRHGEVALPYGELLSPQELRTKLLQIKHFVESYYVFAVNKNREVLKRVFEALLYAMTSPFIHLIRKDLKKDRGEEKLAEVPIVLILGGLANTGKTKLLLFINKLLGNQYEVYNYRDVYTKTQRVLYDLFNSNNVFPILVDEIYDNFFRGEGERLIKSLTNTLTDDHPCLIGTTNVSFNAESQVIRRIYFLYFSSPFSEDKSVKGSAERYFEEKVGDIDDGLFRHFLVEYARRASTERFYTLEDPLLLSRAIFKELFRRAGLGVPDFLSDKPCGDYYKLGSIEWQALFKVRRKDFREMKEGGEVYFVVDPKIFKDTKEMESLRNKLPPSVVKSMGTPLILHRDRFLSFIGCKEGLLKRFFVRLKA